MSNFAKEIETLKRDKNITAADLVEATNVDPATWSRLKSGERNVTFDDLKLITRAFPMEAPRLLRARLLDECDGPGGGEIEISIKDDGGAHVMRDLPPAYGNVVLAPAVEDAIARIIQALGSDAKLRNVIQWLGERLPPVSSVLKDSVSKGTVAALKRGRVSYRKGKGH